MDDRDGVRALVRENSGTMSPLRDASPARCDAVRGRDAVPHPDDGAESAQRWVAHRSTESWLLPEWDNWNLERPRSRGGRVTRHARRGHETPVSWGSLQVSP